MPLAAMAAMAAMAGLLHNCASKASSRQRRTQPPRRYYPFSGRTLTFHDFVICMPEALTAGRTFTGYAHAKEGTQTSEFILTDKQNSPFAFDGMAYCASFKQDAKGPDVDVEIFLDEPAPPPSQRRCAR